MIKSARDSKTLQPEIGNLKFDAYSFVSFVGGRPATKGKCKITCAALRISAQLPCMENEASKTRAADIAFLVDAELLKRLEEIFCELKGTREYSVKFSDGSTVKYTDVEDIIGQPNSGKRFIGSIIAGVEARAGRSAFVTLRDSPSPSVEYTINVAQRDVIYLADKLDDWVAASRQWYSLFYVSGFGIIFGMTALFAPLLLLDRIYKYFFPALAAASGGKPAPWMAIILLVVMYVAEYWFYKLFPQGTFAVGHGLRRHHMFSYLRTGVIAAFLISILANWVTRHL